MKNIFILVTFALLALILPITVLAQESNRIPVFESSDLESSQAAIASDSAMASASATTIRRILNTDRASDITEVRGEAKGKLEQFVLDQQPGPLGITNFLRLSIRSAVDQGVPANTIVLVLMFPVVIALIAASRHLVGLRGFGIFTPALVSVTFLATGLTAGFILFLVILLVATGGRVMIRKLRMPYMPRTSLLLWLVSLGVLALLILSPYLKFQDLANLSIFPILLMVLLGETFIEVQTKRSRQEAVEMTLETLLLAVVGYFLMKLEMVQMFVLGQPELVVVGVAVFNIFLGKFGGLRLMEYWRFKQLLK